MFLLAFYGVWRVEAWSSKWHCLCCMVVEQVLLHTIYFPWMAEHCSAVYCVHAFKGFCNQVKPEWNKILMLTQMFYELVIFCHVTNLRLIMSSWTSVAITIICWLEAPVVLLLGHQHPFPAICHMNLRFFKPSNQDIRMPVQVFQHKEPVEIECI